MIFFQARLTAYIKSLKVRENMECWGHGKKLRVSGAQNVRASGERYHWGGKQGPCHIGPQNLH